MAPHEFQDPDWVREIDRRCDRFERDWREGHHPKIEAYLEQSRVAAQREEQEREAARQRELERAQRLAETQAKVAQLFKRFAGTLAIGLCVAIGLMIWAFMLRQEARRQEATANEQRVIAQQRRPQSESLSAEYLIGQLTALG